MKIVNHVSVIVLSVAALSSAAVAGHAATYTITQNFNGVAVGSAAQPLFASAPLTVAYAFRATETDPWEVDTSFTLNVESNGSNVLGDGQGEIIFALQPNVFFDSFRIDAVPTGSPFASDPVTGYFQSLTGTQLGTFTFNPLIASTRTLVVPANTSAIILPKDVQYDNVVLAATGTVVPEAGTLPLALGGFVGLVGALVVRRKK